MRKTQRAGLSRFVPGTPGNRQRDFRFEAHATLRMGDAALVLLAQSATRDAGATDWWLQGENTHARLQPASRVWPDQDPSPEVALAEYESALQRREAAEVGLAALPERSRWHTRRLLRQRSEAQAELSAARAREHEARAALPRSALGAQPNNWGVLSAGGRFNLEASLRALHTGEQWFSAPPEAISKRLAADRPEVLDAMARLQDDVLPARLAAARGDRRFEQDIIARLHAIVVELMGVETAVAASHAWDVRQARQVLQGHLPRGARPRARDLTDLETRHAATLLLNTGLCDAPGCPITVHDFYVLHEVLGCGLGTAALGELCDFADRYRRTITASFVPGRMGGNNPNLDPVYIPRMANWYHRHGFRVGDKPPTEWSKGDKICRRPASSP
jgi:hypothetical protein